jgi:amino acid adenylation domain-containing protein
MEFTRFPNLYSNGVDNDGLEGSISETISLTWALEEKPDEDLIIYSWASILKSYTGNDDLIFYTDNNVIKVKTSEGKLEKELIAAANADNHTTDCTGVYFSNSSEKPTLALQLIFDAAHIRFTLNSYSHVPNSHLQELLEHFKLSLSWMQKHGVGNVPFSELSELTSSASNTDPKSLHGPSLLHDLVSHSDSRHAVEFLDADGEMFSLSYEELHSLSSALASKIRQSLKNVSLSTQPIIALLIAQSAELYVSQLAILKAGGAFCSVNLDTPEERFAFILGDIAAPLVLTTSQYAAQVPKGTQTLDVSLSDLVYTKDETSGVAYEVTASDPAYVMYTSGSTGTPKGVPVSHKAVTQSILAHDRHIPPYYRFLQFAAPTFDVSLFEIFFTFFRGTTLVACDRRILLDDLTGTMNKLNIDAAELTPTVAGSLLQRRSAVPGLRLLLTIGEMLTKPVMDEFGGNGDTDSILWAMYGPTEAAIHCTVMPSFQSASRVGNIGYPLDTVSAFIASPQSKVGDSTMDMLPIGFVGELVVGGSQLAEGYLNRSEQTNSAFIIDPRYGRLYRTGDKARRLPDGSFECLGRMSSGQVKLRGQRIELGEIENTALRVVGCHAAAASIISNSLILFCCVNKGVLADDILAATKRWLPEFMNPAEVILLDSFPHLPSGKIDKKALEALYLQRHNALNNGNSVILDEDAVEILKIIEGLSMQKASPASSLVSLRIDSLTAILLVSHLRKTGFNITTIDVLKCDTVLQLCSICRRKTKILDVSEQSVVAPSSQLLRSILQSHVDMKNEWHNCAGIRCCTPVQLGMLIETMKDSKSYWNSIDLLLDSTVDEHVIRSAIKKVVSDNEILRSGFVYAPETEYQFLQIVWTNLPEENFEPESTSHGLDMKSQSVLLRPLRIGLQKLDGGVKLSIHLHHAIYDGWSMDLIVNDLRNLIENKPVVTRPSFNLVQQYYASLDLTKSLEYWESHLFRCSPTVFKRFHSEESLHSAVSCQSWTFSRPVKELQERAAALKVTPQCLFQAAFSCLLAQSIGLADVMVATVTSGRTIAVDGVENIIGPCMSTLPLRVNISHARSIQDLLRNIHVLNRRIVEHSGASMREIKRYSGIAPGTPLSDALFIWQETLESKHRTEKSLITVLDSLDQVEFTLVLEVEPRESQTHGKLSWRPGLLTDSQAHSILRKVDELVNIFLQEPQGLVINLPLTGTNLKETSWKSTITQLLPEPQDEFFTQNEQNTCVKEPLTRTENIIQQAIVKLMKIPTSTINHHVPLAFYGIDSLYSIGLSKLLRENGYPSVSAVTILQCRSVHLLSKALDDAQPALPPVAGNNLSGFISTDEEQALAVILNNRQVRFLKILPCTPLQEAMLSAAKNSSDAYSNTMIFKLNGSPERLKQAWIMVLDRHEIFKTAFLQTENSQYPFVQVILSHFSIAEMVSQSPGNKNNCEIQQLQEKLLPPHQISIIEDNTGVRLKFVCHHAVFDATAIHQLLLEVETAYNEQPLPPAVSIEPFLSISLSQRSIDNTQFWCDHLRGFSPKLVKVARKGEQKTYTASCGTTLKQVERVVSSLSTSMLAIFQATLSKTLSHLLQTQDVCFGNVVSGRTYSQKDLDRLIFPTFNTVPMRVDLSSHQDNTSLFQSLRQFSLNTLPYQLAPLRSTQSLLGFSATGLFSILLLMQQGSFQLDQNIWKLESDLGNMAVSFAPLIL